MKWIALFSQTGSEICEISKKLGRWPDWVVTNKQNWDDINDELVEHTIISYVPDRPDLGHYKLYLRENNTIITLNGWLRIVPPEICDKYEIYNGHPGLITEYPELKGKDPQLKAIELGHNEAGCVLHKATAILDDGPIIAESEKVNIKNLTENQVFEALHKSSVDMWVKFLTIKLSTDEN